MAAETQYTANTFIGTFAGANTALDGSGTNVLTTITAASNGTMIKSVILKATGNTSDGMVRLFVSDGTNNRLIKEIKVYAATQAASDVTFNKRVMLNFKLKATWTLKATTQNADSINIIVEALDFAYYATSVRPESTNYTAKTGLGTALVNTANSNLDGVTGSNITIVTAGTGAAGFKGCVIESITIKAQAAVANHGMIRLYLQNAAATTTKLFKEIPIDETPQSATHPTLEKSAFFRDKLQIAAGWSLIASTQASDSFAVTAECLDWTYPA